MIEIIEAAINGNLTRIETEWKEETAICVVLASGGYPGHYETGKPITGLKEAEQQESIIFHAGTAMKNDEIITAGGRVLGVTNLGKNIQDARQKTYEAVSKIHFNGMHYRKDIGQ